LKLSVFSLSWGAFFGSTRAAARSPWSTFTVRPTPTAFMERYRLIDREAAIEAHARTGKENISIPNNDSGLIIDAGYPGKALRG
jgi:hypothetical protein